MHARRIDRARTGAARADRLRRILSSVQCRRGRRSQHRIVIRARRSTPFPLSPCPDMSLQPPRPSSTRTENSGSTANGIEAAPAQLDCAALSCWERLSRHPRCAPSTRTWPSHILVGLSFNALVHCGAGDRALTSPAADRRKTKPSDREARVRPGDRDPPTPKGTAERSARA